MVVEGFSLGFVDRGGSKEVRGDGPWLMDGKCDGFWLIVGGEDEEGCGDFVPEIDGSTDGCGDGSWLIDGK